MHTTATCVAKPSHEPENREDYVNGPLLRTNSRVADDRVIATRRCLHYQRVTAKLPSRRIRPRVLYGVVSLHLLSCTGSVGLEQGANGALDSDTVVEGDAGATTSGANATPGAQPPGASTPNVPGAPGVTPNPTSPNVPGVNPPNTTETPTTPTTPGPAPVQCEGPADPGPTPLLRLTRRQYRNTLQTLLGDVPDLSAAYARDEVSSGVGAGQGDISQVEVEDLQRAAELAAAAAVAGDGIERLAPCPEGRAERDCAADFVTDFGTRAYRAPVTDAADVERHLSVFDAGYETDYRRGIELLLRAMLQSGRFIYRLEFGDEAAVADDSAVPLSGYEVATRLSYAFLNTTPDASLLAAAASGQLGSAEGVSAALDELLTGEHRTEALERFLGTLILLDHVSNLPKDPELYPEWNSELRSAMNQQAQHWFAQLLAGEDASLADLLTSQTVLSDATLAGFYGVEAGSEFTSFEDPHAAGILTLPAFLALNAKPDESSPVHRGKFVRDMLLCQPPPAPPDDIPAPPEVDATASSRERLNQHVADRACSNCHRLLDPIGFTFEHYDAIGRYRDTDGGKPVDATGELIGAGDASGKVDGVVELATRLASSPDVEQCLTKQWFRQVFGRFETQADACTIERLTTAFRDANTNLGSLPQAIVATEAFRYRRRVTPSEPSN